MTNRKVLYPFNGSDLCRNAEGRWTTFAAWLASTSKIDY
jgi:hypothetical protein